MSEQVEQLEQDARKWIEGASTLDLVSLYVDYVEYEEALRACQQEREALRFDVALLERGLKDAIEQKSGWDLQAKAYIEPLNRLVLFRRSKGDTPSQAKAAFDAALNTEVDDG
jgi:hypothetical protein